MLHWIYFLGLILLLNHAFEEAYAIFIISLSLALDLGILWASNIAYVL